MGGAKTDLKLIDENGLRLDGRSPNELRPIKIQTDSILALFSGSLPM